MRITEILESKYNEPRHSIASLATDNYESSLVAVDTMWDYVSDNLNDDDLTKLYQDFVEVENKLEDTIL